MAKQKSNSKTDILQTLVSHVERNHLEKLIFKLAKKDPETKRECLEFLKKHAKPGNEPQTESEIIFTIWNELEPDLSDLDEYGGGDYGLVDQVDELLYELADRLKKNKISQKDRSRLLDEVFHYIKSGNAGMDDTLYDVAYASCHDAQDWRELAKRFEELGDDWPLGHARDIYRKIGDHEKYLSLRLKQMKHGGDYHDLATFYWENGEKEKAIQLAREGLEKGEGRKDELRAFLSARVKTKNRKEYLDLQFDQAMDPLSLKSYVGFKNICKEEEWNIYEPKFLSALDKAWDEERLKIYLHRKEYDQAIQLFEKKRYPLKTYDGGTFLKVATQLEEKYPEKILRFYQSGLGNLNSNHERSVYADQAQVALKIRNLWINVIKKPDQWKTFAKEIKVNNLNKPAFQQEFAKMIPDWKEI
ncbi:MAG: hypothetical protein HQM15_10525 [Deltaproteobacteria bacterium]|nr:hypothetical protein [Deltaproteobacteria bacterium]